MTEIVVAAIVLALGLAGCVVVALTFGFAFGMVFGTRCPACRARAAWLGFTTRTADGEPVTTCFCLRCRAFRRST